MHEIIALEADVVALQEVRIGADSVPGMRSTFKQYGYNLYFSDLPNYKKQGHNKKSIHLEQSIPELPLPFERTYRCRRFVMIP